MYPAFKLCALSSSNRLTRPLGFILWLCQFLPNLNEIHEVEKIWLASKIIAYVSTHASILETKSENSVGFIRYQIQQNAPHSAGDLNSQPRVGISYGHP